MSRFQIQARYDRTLKTTSCSRAWSITFRPKSSFGPTSVVGVWSTSRDSTFWRKSVVCSQIWITSPTRNVTALELDGRDGEVAVIVTRRRWSARGRLDRGPLAFCFGFSCGFFRVAITASLTLLLDYPLTTRCLITKQVNGQGGPGYCSQMLRVFELSAAKWRRAGSNLDVYTR